MKHEAQVIADDAYDEICGTMRDHAGIELERTRRFALGARVQRRVRELGLGDATQYCAYLRMGPQRVHELDELLRLASIGETSFGRYPLQLEFLERAVLPRVIEANRRERRLRLWSAGCATGQEAYDLAMIVHRALGVRIDDWDVRILATDINAGALARAEAGWYSRDELRDLHPDDHDRFFAIDGAGSRVRETLGNMVAFRAHNLRDAMAARRLGRFDVICCRNVLCHFGARAREDAVGVVRDRLEDEGVLLVGHRDPVDHGERLFEPIGGAPTRAWTPVR